MTKIHLSNDGKTTLCKRKIKAYSPNWTDLRFVKIKKSHKDHCRKCGAKHDNK